jgi:hypothetical protein
MFVVVLNLDLKRLSIYEKDRSERCLVIRTILIQRLSPLFEKGIVSVDFAIIF